MLDGAGRGFDAVMRGYDRAQVDHYLDELDEQQKSIAADRDMALSRSADLAAQLASTQAQIESLRRQLEAAAPTTPANIDERVAATLNRAAGEAAGIKAAAEYEAAAIRAAATDAAARTTTTAERQAAEIIAAATQRHAEADEMFRQRLAEADRKRVEIETALTARQEQVRAEELTLTQQAQAERDRLNGESAAERDRLTAESETARHQAEADFELVLRERRSSELAESERILADARDQAAAVIAAAETRARQLQDYRDAVHAQLRGLHGDLGSRLDEAEANATGFPPAEAPVDSPEREAAATAAAPEIQ